MGRGTGHRSSVRADANRQVVSVMAEMHELRLSVRDLRKCHVASRVTDAEPISFTPQYASMKGIKMQDGIEGRAILPPSGESKLPLEATPGYALAQSMSESSIRDGTTQQARSALVESSKKRARQGARYAMAMLGIKPV
jgi:hypothetical protein